MKRKDTAILRFGLAVAAGLITALSPAGAQTTIAVFPSLTAYVDLVPGPAGEFYGVANEGNINFCELGCGTVFKLSLVAGEWQQTTLHTFTGADGAYPYAGVILDAAGNIYGTTSAGGIGYGSYPGHCLGYGCGLVFKLSQGPGGQWTETVLHAFTGGEDGASPTTLILGPSGALMGVASSGGSFAGSCGSSGCGLVYSLSTGSGGAWQEDRLHVFTGGANGQGPNGLILDPSGDLFGVASGGQLACSGLYCGVVFKLTASSGGWKESLIHTFQGPDGAFPVALTVRNGSIYGTTSGGGASCCGTVFQLSASGGAWKESALYSFTTNDSGPTTAPVFSAKGDIYAGVQIGDPSECNPFLYGYCGVIVDLAQNSGTWQVKNQFPAPNWFVPTGNIVVGSSGTIYAAACDEYYFNGAYAFEVTP